MSIVHSVGTVDFIKVRDKFAGFDEVGFCVIKEDQTNVVELFIIWVYESSPSASDLALHNMWLSMLQEAMATGRKVQIGHEQLGGLMHYLQIDKLP